MTAQYTMSSVCTPSFHWVRACVKSASCHAGKNQQTTYLAGGHCSIHQSMPTKLLTFGEGMQSDQLHGPAIGTVDFCFSLMLFAVRSLPCQRVCSGFGLGILKAPVASTFYRKSTKVQFKVRSCSQRCDWAQSHWLVNAVCTLRSVARIESEPAFCTAKPRNHDGTCCP